MFPISDDNPSGLTPFITWTLIGVCVLVFVVQFSMSDQEVQATIYSFGMIPARVLEKAQLPPEIAIVPAWTTVITSMFMHGGLFHIAGNLLFLWIFGDNVEDSMGHVRFLMFYVVCGVAAAMTQAFLSPESLVPMVGASGAISGVLGAYLLLYPQATVRVLVFFGVFVTVIHVPAIMALGLWFLGQLFSATNTPADQPGVAFWAHVGGFVAGMVLVPIFKSREIPLFQQPHSRPFEREQRRRPRG